MNKRWVCVHRGVGMCVEVKVVVIKYNISIFQKHEFSEAT